MSDEKTESELHEELGEIVRKCFFKAKGRDAKAQKLLQEAIKDRPDLIGIFSRAFITDFINSKIMDSNKTGDDPTMENLVSMAQANVEGLNEGTESLERLVEQNDVVWAVWPVPLTRTGYGFRIIKGEARLQGIKWTGKAATVRVTAIPCESAEQAEALRISLGQNN